jgi:hypothetical protein
MRSVCQKLQVLLKALCGFEDLLYGSHAHTKQHAAFKHQFTNAKAIQGTNLNNLINHNYFLCNQAL